MAQEVERKGVDATLLRGESGNKVHDGTVASSEGKCSSSRSDHSDSVFLNDSKQQGLVTWPKAWDISAHYSGSAPDGIASRFKNLTLMTLFRFLVLAQTDQ